MPICTSIIIKGNFGTIEIPYKYLGKITALGYSHLYPKCLIGRAICGPGVFPQIRGHEQLDFMSRIDNSGIVKRAQI